MEWISIKEKQPNNIDFVLALFNNKDVQILPCWYRKSTGSWYQYDRSLKVNDEITHWMPFPRAPKK